MKTLKHIYYTIFCLIFLLSIFYSTGALSYTNFCYLRIQNDSNHPVTLAAIKCKSLTDCPTPAAVKDPFNIIGQTVKAHNFTNFTTGNTGACDSDRSSFYAQIRIIPWFYAQDYGDKANVNYGVNLAPLTPAITVGTIWVGSKSMIAVSASSTGPHLTLIIVNHPWTAPPAGAPVSPRSR